MPDYEVVIEETRKVLLRCVVTGAEDPDHARDCAEGGDVDSEEELPNQDYDVLYRKAVNTKELGAD